MAAKMPSARNLATEKVYKRFFDRDSIQSNKLIAAIKKGIKKDKAGS